MKKKSQIVWEKTNKLYMLEKSIKNNFCFEKQRSNVIHYIMIFPLEKNGERNDSDQKFDLICMYRYDF